MQSCILIFMTIRYLSYIGIVISPAIFVVFV